MIKLKEKQAVAFDFDGVIHKYTKGWQNGEIYDEVNTEMVKLINILQTCGIPIFVLSTRSSEQIEKWWKKNINIPCKIIDENTLFYNDIKTVGITNKKLPAQLYIDDRAYRYDSTITATNFLKEVQLSDYSIEFK